MKKIKIKIESPLHLEYLWTLGVFADFIGFEYEITAENEDILIAEHGMGDIQLSHFFKNIYSSGDYQFKSYFKKEPLHYTSSGKPDYLSTCFYLLSYLQEYIDYHPDKYGRFPYDISLQKHFNCIEENLVANYFIALYESTLKLKSLIERKINPSSVLLTHDIDSVYGALGDNYKYLLKHGKAGTLLQLIFNHYLRTPDYLLLDKIMDIEDANDVKSVFFWIVNQGKGTRNINNADYNFDDRKIRLARKNISERGYLNGLHKSAGRDNYKNELKKFGNPTAINRNHYLITELPDTFNEIEAAELKADLTMGFPDAIGFRNNYGLPIRPFHLKEKRAYNFLEVPLTIMDTSLKYYQNKNSKEAEIAIIDFITRNKQNALITILWHNNYFFDMADSGWIACYKNVLHYIRENNFGCYDIKSLTT
ncbi:MAG: DUF7033 domain-containing protein [Chitinophagales bacterium]